MSSIYKTFNNKNSYLLLIASQIYIIISFISSFYKTKTLKPWSDEIVSLVSNYNFYLNNFNFIGPYGTEYFTSYSPKLTAGPFATLFSNRRYPTSRDTPPLGCPRRGILQSVRLPPENAHLSLAFVTFPFPCVLSLVDSSAHVGT